MGKRKDGIRGSERKGNEGIRGSEKKDTGEGTYFSLSLTFNNKESASKISRLLPWAKILEISFAVSILRSVTYPALRWTALPMSSADMASPCAETIIAKNIRQSTRECEVRV